MPQQGGANPYQQIVQQAMDSMNPEELKLFFSKSQEEQLAIIQQLLGGNANG
jgi:hypothetical protein